jgi:GNAT superfamily N-acetyltransferase
MALEFDDPHLLRGAELAASERLSHLCFGGPSPIPADEAAPTAYQAPRRGGTYVIAHRGTPVSQISIFHHTLKVYDGQIRVGCIGGVCTHPDYRGHGLAGRLMEHCTRQLAQEGARLMLISGERGLYTRLGNARVGRYVGFTFGPEPNSWRSTPQNLSLRLATPADASLCSQLYQAEPVHFIRKVTEIATHLSHPNQYIHADPWIIERSRQPVAYLFLGLPWDLIGQPQASIRHVGEYAGSRVALAEALGEIMARQGLQQLSWPVAWQDTDLIHLLQGRGSNEARISLPEHTMRIIHFPGLMADLRPYLRARLKTSLLRGFRVDQSGPLLGGSGHDRYLLAHGPEQLELEGAAMTRLVMGSPENIPVHADGVLAEVIAALFPLPSFFPGLNYQ